MFFLLSANLMKRPKSPLCHRPQSLAENSPQNKMQNDLSFLKSETECM